MLQLERCKNCGRTIGNLEQGYVFNGKVVCEKCDKVLRQQFKNNNKVLRQQSKNNNKDDSGIYAIGIFLAILMPIFGFIVGCVLAGKGHKKAGGVIMLSVAMMFLYAVILGGVMGWLGKSTPATDKVAEAIRRMKVHSEAADRAREEAVASQKKLEEMQKKSRDYWSEDWSENDY